MTLAACAGLAFGGAVIQWQTWPIWAMIAYWLGFLFLLLLTLYIAVLDIRYIRAEYAVMKRELFRETLGDEELRKALIEGERRMREKARREQEGKDGAG